LIFLPPTYTCPSNTPKHDTEILLHGQDSTNAIALLHDVEGLIDLGQRLAVRNELVDLEPALEVIFDKIGKLAAALDAAEGTALPYATRDELES